VFDIGVALIFSSFIQLAFSAGLGLNLPSGILTGVLSWIS
jgi:putative tricarboxylic transport membrane protein